MIIRFKVSSSEHCLRYFEFEIPQSSSDKRQIGQFKKTLNGFEPTPQGLQLSDGVLRFSKWDLFHAAKKAELARTTTANVTNLYGLLFYLEHMALIGTSRELRLAPKASRAYKDASSSYMAGRLGEAAAHLLMHKMGYAYWDHLETFLNGSKHHHLENTNGVVVSGTSGTGKEFDFVFQDANGDTALVEAKGSFVPVHRNSIQRKTRLSSALDQLKGWSSQISPRPTHCYAIVSWLLEESDKRSAPSMIGLAELQNPSGPPMESGPEEVNKTRLLARNYGSWLIGMGLGPTGMQLRIGEPKEDRSRVALTRLRRGNRDYVADVSFGLSDLYIYCMVQRSLQKDTSLDEISVPVMGVEEGIMRVIETSVREGSRALQEAPSLTTNDLEPNPEQPPVSVFRDGTMVGAVKLSEIVSGERVEFAM